MVEILAGCLFAACFVFIAVVLENLIENRIGKRLDGLERELHAIGKELAREEGITKKRMEFPKHATRHPPPGYSERGAVLINVVAKEIGTTSDVLECFFHSGMGNFHRDGGEIVFSNKPGGYTREELLKRCNFTESEISCYLAKDKWVESDFILKKE